MAGSPDNGRNDVWSDWLLHHRHSDNAAYAADIRDIVARHADRVLDASQLGQDMTLADIGAGDGAVAFRAIDRIGRSLRVVLTDISAPMLKHAESLALQRGVRDQCVFVQCPADDLGGIADASVDVIATRAVLAYVPDKTAALREFYRVLKPGGRISMAEPVFQDEALYAMALKARIDQPIPGRDDRFIRLLHRWKAAQFPDTPEKLSNSPISNYSERDLIEFVKGAGFADIHLELHIDVKPSVITSWDVFLDNSPHPWAPTLRKILAEQFDSEERKLFESMMKPNVESGRSITTDRNVYLSAAKPALQTAR